MTEQPSVGRDQLASYLNDYLQTSRIQDYCPNGLQVEGRSVLRRIVTGVTASLRLIEHAVRVDADAIVVHHGLFWKGDPQTVSGFRRRRLSAVLANDLNVFAYHLPLDLHPQVGNNVQLGLQMGWTQTGVAGDKGLVCLGQVPVPMTVGQVLEHIERVLGRKPQWVGDSSLPVQQIAWCTGGAPSYVELAAQHGATVYVTGELSEPAAHVAMETGTVLIGAGHHATERGGPQALGLHVAEQFGVQVDFVDCFVDV